MVNLQDGMNMQTVSGFLAAPNASRKLTCFWLQYMGIYT